MPRSSSRWRRDPRRPSRLSTTDTRRRSSPPRTGSHPIAGPPRRSCRRRSWPSGTEPRHSTRQPARSPPGSTRSLATGRSTGSGLRVAGRRWSPCRRRRDREEDDTQALERLVSDGSIVGGAAPGPSPEQAYEAVGLQEAISLALSTMPEAERTVIQMAYQEELSQSEIAARLGWPLGTVKTRTRRALLRLREGLGAEFGPGAELAVMPVPVGEDR